MTISHLAIVILGWIGAAASIAAYYLVSSKRFAPDSLRYHSLNVSSCILLAMACASTGAWPSFLTNAIFIGGWMRHDLARARPPGASHHAGPTLLRRAPVPASALPPRRAHAEASSHWFGLAPLLTIGRHIN